MSDVVEVATTQVTVTVQQQAVTVEQINTAVTVDAGVRGPQGAIGPQGAAAPEMQWIGDRLAWDADENGVINIADADLLTAPHLTGPAGADGAPGPAGPGVPIGGTAGQVLAKIDGTDYNTQWATRAVSVNVQEFAIAGNHTWTKPAGAVLVEIVVIGGGGGGGSGQRRAAGVTAQGGGGGAAGGLANAIISASRLSDTETVVVGVGGAGGAAQSADGGNGFAGAVGAKSRFGNFWSCLQTAANGGSGLGGGTAGQSYCQWSRGLGSQNNGAAGTTAAGSVAAGPMACHTPTGGGGGGGVNAANQAHAGGSGALLYDWAESTNFLGTVNGGSVGQAGGPGESLVKHAWPIGGGGGGGGSAVSAASGSGGNGGWPGGGGGGGAGSRNGYVSGAGGNGADGYVLVVTYCTAGS